MTKACCQDLLDVSRSAKDCSNPRAAAASLVLATGRSHRKRLSKCCRIDVDHLLRCFCGAFAWWVVLVLLPGPDLAVSSDPGAEAVTLNKAVLLIDANNANDSMQRFVPSGPLVQDLYFQVQTTAFKDAPNGTLTVTNFLAQAQPASVSESRIGIAGTSQDAGSGTPLQVPLTGSDLRIKLTGGALRPGTTYKGSLSLAAAGKIHRWDITLTTGAKGVLAVDPVVPQKFTTFPPFNGDSMGSFSVTLRDKSQGGPYHHVRVRFEPLGTPASKEIASNLTLDAFSFWEVNGTRLQRVDLEQRETNAGAGPASALQIDTDGQRAILVSVKPLSPGEYAGALRFAADESSEDALESKLPLTIQVRHRWILPVLVILFGSLVGWFSAKYLVGLRKAGEMARQVKALQARADHLARPDPSRSGWEFPGEATSYGLARVRVMLSQLGLLLSSAFPVLVREKDIQQQLVDAELRLAALESLHDMRLKVQPVADGRPAAQLALGRLLRGASNLLERPVFAQAHQSDFKALMQTAEAWLAAGTRDEKYRACLVERRNSREIPGPGDPQGLNLGSQIRKQFEELLKKCPSAVDIIAPACTPDQLLECDQTMAKLSLLWRERDRTWIEDLAKECEKGTPVDDLFRLVDERVWKMLEQAAEKDQLKIERTSTAQEDLKAYDLAEVHLRSIIADVGSEWLLHHPLHIDWRITPPGGDVRKNETDGLTLVQYFPEPGAVRIEATLLWQGRKIPLKQDLHFKVVPNPEYRRRRIFSPGFTEWAAMGIAAGFAVATAMGALYDATFGTLGQYLALFLWAAGAGTGGNMFKQLGTTSTPGGLPDVALPARQKP